MTFRVESESGTPDSGPSSGAATDPVQPLGGTYLSRRVVVAWLIGVGAGAAGALAGLGRFLTPNTVLQLPSGATAEGSCTETSVALSPVLLNLRPLKPYNLSHLIVTFTQTTHPSGGGAAVDRSIAIGADGPQIAVADAGVLTIAVPADDGPIADVEVVALSGGPVPVLERLRDMGRAGDVEQVTVPGQQPPAVGDLWCLFPRDHPWPRGQYQLQVRGPKAPTTLTFGLV